MIIMSVHFSLASRMGDNDDSRIVFEPSHHHTLSLARIGGEIPCLGRSGLLIDARELRSGYSYCRKDWEAAGLVEEPLQARC